MKKVILILTLITAITVSATFLYAQSISSYSIITTGSVLKSENGDGYSLTQPMYNELVQKQSANRTMDDFESFDALHASQQEIKIFPNPFTELLTVNINAKEDGKLKIELYSILGAKVIQDITFLYFSGISEIPIDLSELPEGMYFIRVIYTVNNESKLIKLIKHN